MHQLVSPNTIPTQADSPQYGLLLSVRPWLCGIGDFTGRALPNLVQNYKYFFKDLYFFEENGRLSSGCVVFGELHWRRVPCQISTSSIISGGARIHIGTSQQPP